MKNITIIGSGFAALSAVKTIRKQNKDVEITLISPKAELVYLPSLIWVSSGEVDKKDIIIPLDNFFKRMNVSHVKNKIIGITENGRIVATPENFYENDVLIVASGGRFIKKLPGIENVITPCEGLDAAYKIRDKLSKMDSGNIAIGFASNPKEPSAMRGGPMFEFLFGIDTQLRKEKRRDKFNLTFFTPTSKPGAKLGKRAVNGLLAEMKKRNINTHLGNKIKSFETNKVITEGGEIAADLILFMPGMTGDKYFESSDIQLSTGGMLKADKFCQTSFQGVFVAGDSGSFPGPDWMPKQAHMADLQGVAAAKNALEVLDNKEPSHSFKIKLMCIVDSNNKGIFIMRTLRTGIILPNCRIFHLLKKLFAWWYIKQYR